MIIRSIRNDDIPQLREINARCHPEDSFPNVDQTFLVITKDNGQIISAGGVELIAEGVTITDKSLPYPMRAFALIELLRSMMLTCGRLKQSYLHIFINNNDIKYMNGLQRAGFELSDSRMLYWKV